MADTVEVVVKNFSGLSSETKPTIAAGNEVPNGSRWREVDTGIIYHFNFADDAWYAEGETNYCRVKPYLYVSDNIKYICKNTDIDANDTDTDWVIWKYSDAEVPEKEGPRTGAVTNAGVIDALSWNI